MTLAGLLPPALLAALSPLDRAAFFLLVLAWGGSLIWFAWSVRGFFAEVVRLKVRRFIHRRGGYDPY